MALKTIKQIKIDIDKCIGCRACEVACSAFHATPRFSSNNPARSRIRVLVDELKDTFVPVRAGSYTPAECTGRYTYTIDGKQYRECSFCRAPCPSRGYFKDPETGLPLQCDMCESDPKLKEPWCVKVCGCDALTYVERKVTTEQDAQAIEDMQVSLASLADKYGMDQIMTVFGRMSKQAEPIE